MTDKPKVLLMQPPIYDFALYDLFLKPYGLLRVGRWLQESSYDVSYLNALDWRDSRTAAVYGPVKRKRNGTGKFFRQPAELPEGIVRIPKQYSRYGVLPESISAGIEAAQPDLVLITTGMTYWYEGVIEAVRLVRTHAPQAKVVLGGIYATLMTEHAESCTGADAVIPGDGAEQLRSLLTAWGFPLLKGPLPVYPLLLPNAWQGSAGVVRLNTGCPFHCDYCASDQISPQFMSGDADEGFSFLKEIHDRFGIEHVGFYDDALLVHKEQVLIPFLEQVIRSGISWKFYTPNAVHVRFIDREIAVLMKRAGFQEVRMGFESSSAAFHEEYDRKFEFDEFMHAVAVLRDAGFSKQQLPVYVLAGLPGQSRKDVERSVLAAAAAGVGASIAEFSPVPGTLAWDQTIEQCQYPIDREPLYHNNSFQPSAWEGMTREDMHAVKLLARSTRA